MMAEKKEEFRPGRRTKVIDFRGRSHELCGGASVGSEAGANRRLKWALLMAHRHRWVTWVRVGAGVLCAAVGASVLLRVWASPGYALHAGWLSFWANMLVFCATVAAAIFASKRAVKAAGERALAELLKAEICPACGYSIKGLKAEGDGCRVCPECGGAWKVNPG